ncbi:MAG: metallophosphoesterase family protein [Blautia sp.]|jgi:exonuclease SbcD
MIRFIHLADVHLGAAPDAGEAWSVRREQEIWESFRRAVALAGERKADLLLVAGDLFHRQPLVRELREVNYLFSTIPETTVVLTAGNHDYLKRDSAYLRFPWEENVIGLWGETCESVVLPGKNVRVYGCSYHSREIRESIYDRVRPADESGIHILLAHGGDASHAPMDYTALRNAGFDYVALGHIHKPQILSGSMAYAGALEPLDRNDTGAHGLIVGECEDHRTKISFLPLAVREYKDLVIPVRKETTQFSLEKQVSYEIRQKGADHLYRIRLTGRREQGTAFLPQRLKALGNVTQVEDETVPDFDLEQLSVRYEGTLIGEYIRYFQEKDKLTRTEEQALFYGLQAMLEEHL